MESSKQFTLDFKFGGNVEFLARLERLMERVDAAFNSTETDVKDVGKAFDKTNKKAKESVDTFEKMSGVLGKVAAAFGGISAAMKLVGWSKANMDLYDIQNRAETQLGVTLKNQAALGANYDEGSLDRLKTLASDIQSKTMYGDEALLGGFGELSTYFQDEKSLQKMGMVLADYAAGMTGGGEVGYQEMIDLATGLGKAIDGTYDNLRKKGFDTSELEAITEITKTYENLKIAREEYNKAIDEKDQKKYAEDYNKNLKNLKNFSKEYGELVDAIGANGGEATEAMKVDALARSLETWKGLAEEVAKTPQGKITQLKNAIGDIRENMGKRMYEVVLPLVEKISEHLPDIEKFLSKLEDFAEVALKNLAAKLEQVAPLFVKIAEAILGLLSNEAGFNTFVLAVEALVAKKPLMILAETMDKMQGSAFKLNGALAQSVIQFGLLMASVWAIGKIIEAVNAFIEMMKELWQESGRDNMQALINDNAKNAKKAREKWIEAEETAKKNPNAEFAQRAAFEKKEKYKKYAKLLQQNWNEVYEKGYSGNYMTGITAETIKNDLDIDIKQKFTPKMKSMDEILKELENGAGDGLKGAKGDITTTYNINSNNITQEVTLTADMNKVGLLLNTNLVQLVKKQMKEDHEIRVVTEV